MMTREELNADRPCQHLNGKVIPCTVVISHQECLDLLDSISADNYIEGGMLKAKIERLQAEVLRFIYASEEDCGVLIRATAELEEK